MNPTLPSVDDILPHRGDMLLIDRLLQFDESQLVAECLPKTDAWYSDGGDMPCWVGIELMAQTIAAHVGLQSAARGFPKPGVLLGTRRYQATTGRFVAGHPLQITARRNYLDDSGLGAYECRILDGERELASATVKVFEPADFNAFLKDAST